jgi:hypothetical protein
MSITISAIRREAKGSAADELMALMSSKVSSGEYQTYMEALAAYAEENDIQEAQLKKIVGPALSDIIFKEACGLKMIRRGGRTAGIDSFT